MLQLGAGAAPYLATPALPALLEEIRAMIISSDPSSAKASTQGEKTPLRGSGVSGTGGGGGGGGKGGMRIEPAMSARKSSQKKLRRSREKEASRALSAANAAATSATSGDGAVRGGSGGGSTAGGGSGLRGGCIWTGEAASAEREAVCASLWCLTQVVLCCKGHLPLGGRLAVEDVLHQGLEILAHSAGATGGGGGGAGGIGGDRGSCSRLDDPRVAREFLGLARACLMTPLVNKVLLLLLFVSSNYVLYRYSRATVYFFYFIVSYALIIAVNMPSSVSQFKGKLLESDFVYACVYLCFRSLKWSNIRERWALHHVFGAMSCRSPRISFRTHVKKNAVLKRAARRSGLNVSY